MRIVVIDLSRPPEEIAAEPETLARLAALLDRARTRPVPGRVLPGGLLALPRVEDPTIPPLTVHLRPYSAPMGATP